MLTLEQRVTQVARLFYFIAAISTLNWLLPVFWMFTSVFGSGISIVGVALSLQGQPIAGDVLVGFAAGAFALLGFLIDRQLRWAMAIAAVFLIVDVAVVFVPASHVGALGAEAGLFASMMLVVHGVVMWFLVHAFFASSQLRTNEAIARDLEAQQKLRRALSQTDEPPPPAAVFSTRYRPAPPS